MTEPPHRRGQDHDGLLHRPAMTRKPAPAMPPEEWEAQLKRTPEERRRVLLHAKDEADADGYLTIHGLAALALYGKSYGFTAEDVANLRYLAHERGAFADEMGNLADRIAALLPPA